GLLVEVMDRAGPGSDVEGPAVPQGLGEPVLGLAHRGEPAVVARTKGGERRAERAPRAVGVRGRDPGTADLDRALLVDPHVDGLRPVEVTALEQDPPGADAEETLRLGGHPTGRRGGLLVEEDRGLRDV